MSFLFFFLMSVQIGLWNHLNNIQWYAHEVQAPAKSPRMYNTGEADDLQAFFQDFQITACLGMLKWLSDTFFDRGIKGVQAKKGKVRHYDNNNNNNVY